MTSIAVKQLAHVCIFAQDLAETRDFYRDVLGMEIVFNFTRDGSWLGFYLGAGGRSHVEVENTTWQHCEMGANVLLHCVLKAAAEG